MKYGPAKTKQLLLLKVKKKMKSYKEAVSYSLNKFKINLNERMLNLMMAQSSMTLIWKNEKSDL